MSKEALKLKFETGDKPVGEDFAELIDLIPSNADIEGQIENIVGGTKSGIVSARGDFDTLGDRLESLNGEVVHLKEEVLSPLNTTLTNYGNQFQVGVDHSGTKYDTLDSTGTEMTLTGQSIQESNSGKNLLDATRWQNTSLSRNGYTLSISDDGVISCIGSPTNSSAWTVFDSLNMKELLEVGQSYKLSKKVLAGNTNKVSTIFYSFKNETNNYNSLQTIVGDEERVTTYMQISPNSGEVNETFVIQIEKGSVATEYESYSPYPTPSPDYPSEIKSVGEEVIVDVADGRNLFNFETYPRVVGVKYETIGNNLRIISTSNGGYLAQYFTFDCKPNTIYTFSMAQPLVSKGNCRVAICEVKDGELYGFEYLNLIGNQLYGTFTTRNVIGTDNIKVAIAFYCRNSGVSGDGDVTYSNIQIEEGSNVTEYVPYGKGRRYKIEIDSKGENLLNVADIRQGVHGYGEVGVRPVFGGSTVRCTLPVENAIPITPNTVVTAHSDKYSVAIAELNNGIGLGDTGWKPIGKTTITTKANTTHIAFNIRHIDNSTIDVNNIQDGDIVFYIGNGEVVNREYKSHKTTLLLKEPLRGLSDVIKDKIVIKDGVAKVIRRVGRVVLNGSEDGWYNWNGSKPEDTEVWGFRKVLVDAVSTRNFKVMCDYFKETELSKGDNPETSDHPYYSAKKEAIMGCYANQYSTKFLGIGIKAERLSANTSNAFKEWLSANPIEVIYELETPVEENISLLSPALYKDGNILINTGEIPLYSTTHKVALNMREQVENFVTDISVNTALLIDVLAKLEAEEL